MGSRRPTPVGLHPRPRPKPTPKRTVRVTAHDDHCRLVHDLSADAADWHMATGVREVDGRLWLGSLVEPALAWLDVPA